VNLPTTEKSLETLENATHVDPTISTSKVTDKLPIPRNKNYWILGGLILLLVFLVILLGAKLRGLANQLDALESKSSVALTTAIVKKDAAETDPVESVAQMKSEISKSLPLAQQLTVLIPQIAQLNINPQPLAQNPVKPNEQLAALKSTAPAANAEMKWWRHVGDKFWTPIRNFFHDLVKIQVIDSNEGAPQNLAISPASQQLLKQELRVHLLSARQLLLSGMHVQALDDVNQAHSLVVKNFAIQSKPVEQFVDELEKIQMQIKSNFAPSASNSVTGKK
jgi:uncharacterized protein HemX